MASATEFSDWVAAPAPLKEAASSYYYGSRPSGSFSEDDSVVLRTSSRRDLFNDECCCITTQPLPVEQLWQITVLETAKPGRFDSFREKFEYRGLVSVI